jgi:16S rRNA G966 N2-methylase RsmD
MNADAWLIVEISSRQSSPVSANFTLVTRREYGSSAILIYQAAPSA